LFSCLELSSCRTLRCWVLFDIHVSVCIISTEWPSLTTYSNVSDSHPLSHHLTFVLRIALITSFLIEWLICFHSMRVCSSLCPKYPGLCPVYNQNNVDKSWHLRSIYCVPKQIVNNI
jgi:hypothetical protein